MSIINKQKQIYINWQFRNRSTQTNCYLCLRSHCSNNCQPCRTRESVGHCLWDKQHYDVNHSSRSLETVCCTAWYLRRKLLYEGIWVWVTIWRQCRGFSKSWMSPMEITNVQMLGSNTLIIVIRKKFLIFSFFFCDI